jgi:hypothetical protein
VRFVFFAQSKAVMTQGEWIGGLIIDSAASDAGRGRHSDRERRGGRSLGLLAP